MKSRGIADGYSRVEKLLRKSLEERWPSRKVESECKKLIEQWGDGRAASDASHPVRETRGARSSEAAARQVRAPEVAGDSTPEEANPLPPAAPQAQGGAAPTAPGTAPTYLNPGWEFVGEPGDNTDVLIHPSRFKTLTPNQRMGVQFLLQRLRALLGFDPAADRAPGNTLRSEANPLPR